MSKGKAEKWLVNGHLIKKMPSKMGKTEMPAVGEPMSEEEEEKMEEEPSEEKSTKKDGEEGKDEEEVEQAETGVTRIKLVVRGKKERIGTFTGW
jgi:hypothetical protein